eukprot:2420131-Prymnesium_polylepis.1
MEHADEVAHLVDIRKVLVLGVADAQHILELAVREAVRDADCVARALHGILVLCVTRVVGAPLPDDEGALQVGHPHQLPPREHGRRRAAHQHHVARRAPPRVRLLELGH